MRRPSDVSFRWTAVPSIRRRGGRSLSAMSSLRDSLFASHQINPYKAVAVHFVAYIMP